MKSINEILKDYTAGETELEETNAALKEAGASYHLVPGRNELTEDAQARLEDQQFRTSFAPFSSNSLRFASASSCVAHWQ